MASSVGGDASPQSPQSPAQPAIDGAELARRMLMATEAASMAASTAAQALLELKDRTSSSSSDEKAWYRLLPRPSVFDPDSRETELAQWREWSWSVEQYLASMDPEFAVDLARIRKNSNAEVDMSIMDDSEKKRCTFLYGLYASLLRQRPLMMLKKIEGSNGFEIGRAHV